MRESANSLILWLIFGFLILITTGITGYIIFQKMLSSNQVSSIGSLAVENKSKEKFLLGSFTNLQDTSYLIAPIYLDAKSRSYDSGYDYDTKNTGNNRNFLFVNVNDKSSRRLVESNNFLFLRYEKLGEKAKNNLKQNPVSSSENNPEALNKVEALWYEVIINDSNNNKYLDYNDKKVIAFSEPSGANYNEVIKEIDTILGSYQKENKNMLFFYSSNGKNFVAEVNISNRQVIDTKELTDLQ
jgi:hypothetical protein